MSDSETRNASHGTINFPDGDKYDGDLVNGVMHGAGVFTSADGDVYQGGFADGQFFGTGKHTYTDGDFYEGDFVDGKKHGNGIFHFQATGNRFVGTFVDCKMSRGVLTLSDGVDYEAIFFGGDTFVEGARMYDLRMSLNGQVVKECKFSNGGCCE